MAWLIYLNRSASTPLFPWAAGSSLHISSQRARSSASPSIHEAGAMLWGRVTYEMMESYWPAVDRGDAGAPQLGYVSPAQFAENISKGRAGCLKRKCPLLTVHFTLSGVRRVDLSSLLPHWPQSAPPDEPRRSYAHQPTGIGHHAPPTAPPRPSPMRLPPTPAAMPAR